MNYNTLAKKGVGMDKSEYFVSQLFGPEVASLIPVFKRASKAAAAHFENVPTIPLTRYPEMLKAQHAFVRKHAADEDQVSIQFNRYFT